MDFTTPGVIVLLARLEKAPVGFLSAAMAGNDLEIRKLGVVSSYRRLGLGRQLLQNIFLITHGAAMRCLIDVSENNAEGRAFYTQTGFTELARRKNYYTDGSTAIVMEKILSTP